MTRESTLIDPWWFSTLQTLKLGVLVVGFFFFFLKQHSSFFSI